MSPRPRKASDEEIFGAAMRVMARCGPRDLTLAMIASEAGLTASALVQRFGSKRTLLLKMSERFAESTHMFDSLRASSRTPLGALRAYADCMAGMGTSPDALANSLSWLQQDLTDPDFRRFTKIQARASRRELQRFVEEAVARGELDRHVAPAELARAIEVTVAGSLITWAIHQEGAATTWVRHDLETLLAPHVRSRAGRAKRPGRTAKAGRAQR